MFLVKTFYTLVKFHRTEIRLGRVFLKTFHGDQFAGKFHNFVKFSGNIRIGRPLWRQWSFQQAPHSPVLVSIIKTGSISSSAPFTRLFVSLSFSLSLSPSVPLLVCLSVFLGQSPCFHSLPVSLHSFPAPSLSLSLSHCSFSISLPISVCFYVFVLYVSLTLLLPLPFLPQPSPFSVSFSLSQHVCISVSLAMFPSLFLFLSMSLSFLTLSHFSFPLSRPLCFSLCILFPHSFSLPLFPPLPLPV